MRLRCGSRSVCPTLIPQKQLLMQLLISWTVLTPRNGQPGSRIFPGIARILRAPTLPGIARILRARTFPPTCSDASWDRTHPACSDLSWDRTHPACSDASWDRTHLACSDSLI